MDELKFSSYDVASMIIEEASDKFAPSYIIQQDRLDIFRQYCDVFDKMIKEFNGETFEVSVDEITMRIKIEIGIDDLTIDSDDRRIYTDLLARAISVSFHVGVDSPMLVKLEFPSLWDRA